MASSLGDIIFLLIKKREWKAKLPNGIQTKERIWKVGIDDNKTRKGKFCTRIASGCIQVIGVEDTDEYLKQVAEEEKKRKKVT